MAKKPAKIPSIMPVQKGDIVVLSIVQDITGQISVECQPGLNPVKVMTDTINELYVTAMAQLQNAIVVPRGEMQ